MTSVAILLLAFSLHAQRNIFDGFDDNSNNWPQAAGSTGSMTVAKGYYEISSVAEGYWQHTNTVEHGFGNHFRIEVGVSRDSGTDDSKGAGIVWGCKGDSVRMVFLLYGDGSFVFQKIRNGQSQTFAHNEITYALNDAGFNNLRVERNMETNMYDFSVNEQFILSAPFEVPASDEVGIFCDIAGTFRFDNFWFIEQANTHGSFRPHALSISKTCSDEQMFYQGDNGYSFCVPFGWRVDEYKNTHCAVWPVGLPYQVNVDYAKLAIEDSFSVAAKNDFKIFVDSAKYAYERKVTPLQTNAASKGVECWSGKFEYKNVNDQIVYTVYRCYVYCQEKGGFLLIETTIPSSEENANEIYQQVALEIARSVRWE